MKTAREVIINALSQLADDLGQFEQTSSSASATSWPPRIERPTLTTSAASRRCAVALSRS